MVVCPPSGLDAGLFSIVPRHPIAEHNLSDRPRIPPPLIGSDVHRLY